MICAACLNEGRPLVGQTRIWNDGVEVPRAPVAGSAITVDHGYALCLDHWREIPTPDLDG